MAGWIFNWAAVYLEMRTTIPRNLQPGWFRLNVVAALLACLPAAAAAVPETRSLDGAWEIAFDPDNRGREESWQRDAVFVGLSAKREALVPGCWEEIEKDYEGVVFYRRSFRAPAEWRGRVVRLQFDAVNFIAEVWLNDIAVGRHEGGFTPFEFRVDDLLKFDADNVLTLRVVGPILLQDKRVDGIGPLETPQWRGAITGGIWQSVRLVASGAAFVSDVFIEPRIADDTAVFHAELTHGGARPLPARVELLVREAGGSGDPVAQGGGELKLHPGVNRHDWTIAIPDAKLWSPDAPNLHHAEVRVILDETLSDRWATRFGMREFTVRDRRFHLNGRPMQLKATFWEGLYPVRLANPDSRKMAIREIRLAKEAGFNMIRPWRKPAPPMWLDLCDELGVLTVGSPAIECMDFPVESARLPGWVANEIRGTVLRDRNRACVAQWELFNELKRPVLKRLLQPMADLARELDPTRLILDESGGWARGARLYLPGVAEPLLFNDIHHYPGPDIDDGTFEKLRWTGVKSVEEMRAMGLEGNTPGKNVVPGLMTFFSELGYGSLPDLPDNNRRFAEAGNPTIPPAVYHRRLADEHRRALEESGFASLYPDLSAFCLEQQAIHGRSNRRMIQAVRVNSATAGYCIHALTAGDWIIGAGLLDLWRNPKTRAYEDTKAANQPRILVARVGPRNVYAERGATLEITGVNDLAFVKGRLEIEVMGPDDKVVFSRNIPGAMASGMTPFFSERLDTTQLDGAFELKARFIAQDGRPAAEGSETFDVFSAARLKPPAHRIAVLDPAGALKPFLDRQRIPWSEFGEATAKDAPVFVSRTMARGPAQERLFADLAAFVKEGGTAVYLQGGGAWAAFGVGGDASPLIPVPAKLKQAVGMWTCIPHLVKEHPVFAGLPTGGAMGPVYRNVRPRTVLVGAGGQAVTAAIGFDWFPDYDRLRRHYYGPGDTWWGAGLAIVPHGKGRCILSQLRLLENLGNDPVADKLLHNLILFTAESPQ